MKFLRFVGCILLSASAIFAQGALGTITGTVSDPSGAVVGNASIEVKNQATGQIFKTVSTATGNYTVTALPVGAYDLTATVTGFKSYKRTGLDLAAAQVMRIDVPLEVGSQNESVTVTAEASLLKTESGDMTHNVKMETLTDLPLLGIGTANSGTTGVRNPYNSLQTLPGVSSYNSSGTFTLNGLGGATGFSVPLTETMRIEGQDATSRIFGNYDYTQMSQPSADSIQEIAYQTSNYAAEFGQAGVAVINMTMKSGSNQYHGSGYDYLVNEDLNAGNPFSHTLDGEPGKYRPRNRRNDFGGTLGGPIYIPKVYDGHDKTFFFWNYEQYLETNQYSFTDTVPTPAYLNGDFSAISPNGTCSLCATYGIQSTALPATDALGRPMYANAIYDPSYARHHGQRPRVRESVPGQHHSQKPLQSVHAEDGSSVAAGSKFQSRRQLQRDRSWITLLGHPVVQDRSQSVFQGPFVLLLVQDQHREPDLLSPGERGRSATRDRRVPGHIHPQLHDAAELRPHCDADHPAAPGHGLLSH